MANSLFPQRIAFANAALFCGLALGFAASPALGAALYALQGFELPFFVAAALNFLILFYKLIFHGQGEHHDHVDSEPLLKRQPTEQDPRLRDYCKNPRALFAVLNFYFVGSAYVFFEPILANELVNNYGLSETTSSLLFFGFVGPFGLGGILLLLIPEQVERRKMMIFLGLMAGIFCYLMGPGWPFEKDLGLIIASLVLAGLFSAMSMNSSSGESLKAMKPQFPQHYEELADLNAKVINIMSSANNFINPLLAATLEAQFGYREACSIFGAMIAVFSILYLFADLFLIHKKPLKGSWIELPTKYVEK